MNRPGSHLFFSLILLALSAILWNGCAKQADEGKIPITTSSNEAKKEFLEGRDLAEKLLTQNSIQHFQKAIALDSNFALAELYLSGASPTPKEFFEHLNKAVKLSAKVSEGERLMILGTEAAVNNNNPKQKECYEKLVATYPNDERAHVNLAGYFYGQQEYAKALEHYTKVTTLAPSYAPVYNMLGYCNFQLGNYPDAEKAFKKYIELIPNDPNPYDSQAELQMKMGKFEESIAGYEKALSIDPHFFSAHIGIAANQMFMGKNDEASSTLQKYYDMARDDGDRQTALFRMMLLNIDQGKLDVALQDAEKLYALGEKINDVAAMAGALNNRADILDEAGKYDDAKGIYDRALNMIQGSNLSQEIKDNAKLFQHFNNAKLALGKSQFTAAEAEAEDFRAGAEKTNNPATMKMSHELSGRIALAEKNYDKAIAELEQANLQNPYDLYRLSLAYQGKKDAPKAREYCMKAAQFNSPTMQYAFVRTKAEKMLAGMKG